MTDVRRGNYIFHAYRAPFSGANIMFLPNTPCINDSKFPFCDTVTKALILEAVTALAVTALVMYTLLHLECFYHSETVGSRKICEMLVLVWSQTNYIKSIPSSNTMLFRLSQRNYCCFSLRKRRSLIFFNSHWFSWKYLNSFWYFFLFISSYIFILMKSDLSWF